MLKKRCMYITEHRSRKKIINKRNKQLLIAPNKLQIIKLLVHHKNQDICSELKRQI